MGIITELKNSIRDTIFNKDNSINFNFNEIEVVEYPYIFFYIPSFKLDKAIDSEYWRKLNLMCVVEYAQSEGNNQAVLWDYCDTLADAFKCFDFLDTKISAQNIEFKTVDGSLQMTFDLEIYVKDVDETELMAELDISLK